MQERILKSISYFDIFDHPLTIDEIENLCDGEKNRALVSKELNRLLEKGECYQYQEYFSLQENIADLVKTRKEKEERAQAYFKKLFRYVRIIKAFPFVRGVAVSGSLSKNVMHKDGDIDYFIITKKGRLWICRTLLILFKKIFLLNSRRYFCVNYFIDEDNYEIEDKNIFTAVEVSHLLPVYNTSVFNQFWGVNNWVREFFPHFSSPIKLKPIEGSGWGKLLFEFLLNFSIWDYVDLYFMKITYKRWSRKFGHFNPEKLELTMRSNRGISKHHPRDFQNKVLSAYKDRLSKLDFKYEDTVYA